MRLINATTLKLREFVSDDSVPQYAILSHTWGDDECTLKEMEEPDEARVTQRKGYNKVKLCCNQALRDGFQWVWVDTYVHQQTLVQFSLAHLYSCCIDKTSTAELSEAINSMFCWYRDASTCYAYLSDVNEIAQLAQTRWFTRGWTLQELIAPKNVWFYDSDWRSLGSKLELQQEIQQITNIEVEVLVSGKFDFISVARRMSWAAQRQTTRFEDKAYSLMGIFDVNMPLLYGEGKRAFIRLQEALMKMTDDQSLFAWGLPNNMQTMQDFASTFSPSDTTQMHGIFADSPADFTCSDQICVSEDPQSTLPPIVSNNGVRIELQVTQPPGSPVQFAIVYCSMKEKYRYYLGFPVRPWGGRWVARCGELVLVAVADLVTIDSNVPYRKPSVLLVKAPVSLPPGPKASKVLELVQIANNHEDHYVLKDVQCAPHASYSWCDQTLTLAKDQNRLHAAFHYAPAKADPIELFPSLHYERLKRGVETTLHASQRRDSFLTKAESKKDHYTIIFPPFALLVGGFPNPWVE
jgi:hypothetical protein